MEVRDQGLKEYIANQKLKGVLDVTSYKARDPEECFAAKTAP